MRIPNLSLLLALSAVPQLVHAQSFSSVRLGPPDSAVGIAGVAVVTTPRYLGSTETRALATPMLDYQWRSGWFAGTANGVGYNLSKDAKLQYGLRLSADLGRKERRSPVLRGLGDVDPRFELGGFLNLRPTPHLLITSVLRLGSGPDRKGALLEFGASQAFAIQPQLHASVGLGLSLANRKYLQSYFGVNPAQATSSGHATFSPEAGLRDLRAQIGLSYRAAPQTSLNLGLSASSLRGDARRSPITKKPDAVSAVLALTQRF